MSADSWFPNDDDKPEIPKEPKLHQLAGLGPARVWGEQLIADIRACRAGTLRWHQLDPGALISGPPGTGKTTFVIALAASAGIPIIITGFNKWNAKSGNDISAAINADFDRANANRPCIIFIDELDSIPSRAINNHNTTYFTPIVNVLLKRIERPNLKDGVIVIGATNHDERIDPALKRPGRLDRHLEITLPRAKDLEEIIAFHLKADRYSIGELASIAVLCVGKSGADVEKLVRDARRIARQANRPLSRSDLLAAIEQDAPKLSAADQKRVARHEAGHAVAAYRLAVSDDISLSLLVQNGAAGVMHAPSQTTLLTEYHVVCRLVVLLAGRAAEEKFCDGLSTGSGGGADSDIAKATELAIRSYDDLALRSTWHGPTARRGAPAQDDVLRKARELLDKAYVTALELMDMDREFVRRVADALIANRALSHADIAALDPRRSTGGGIPPIKPPSPPPALPHHRRVDVWPSNDNAIAVPPRTDELPPYANYGQRRTTPYANPYKQTWADPRLHPQQPPAQPYPYPYDPLPYDRPFPQQPANDNTTDAESEPETLSDKVRDVFKKIWQHR